MKFFSFTSYLLFYSVVFIYFLTCFQFSYSLSPYKLKPSLIEQFETDLPNPDDSNGETTTLSPLVVENLESESETSSGEDATSRPDSNVQDCECGIRGVSNISELDLLIPTHKKFDVNLEQPFVLNGTETFRGEFPWLAALTRYSAVFAPKVICGASLITPNVLVTAAHCIVGQQKKNLRLVFNAWKLSPLDDVRRDEKAVMMKIKRLIPHPQFDENTVDNDIGLIELETPVDLLQMKDRIRPVCLPSKSENDYAGSVATVAGWGYTRATGLNSHVLLKANVPILSHEDCQKTPYGTEILPGMVCAGFSQGGTDACTNDSGGPLIVEEFEKSTLVGIVSWGHSCGLPKLPGVYTRVTKYVDWINLQLTGNQRCGATS